MRRREESINRVVGELKNILKHKAQRVQHNFIHMASEPRGFLTASVPIYMVGFLL